MVTYPVRTRRWSRAEYDRLIKVGFFHPEERIELLGGALIVAEPKGTAHETAIGLVDDALRAALGPGWIIRAQSSVALDDESEPEPDVAVVSGTRRDYSREHPSRPVLVIEVAESSLGLDRRRKGSLYARAGLDDYWILNLKHRVLEIYRDPRPDSSARFGWRYFSRTVLGPEAFATPLTFPAVRLRVADFLP